MNPISLSASEVRHAMQRGLLGYRPPEPKPKSYHDPQYYKKRRKALKARGLTARGTPRKREWVSLKDMSPEQRKARLHKQQRESRIRRAK